MIDDAYFDRLCFCGNVYRQHYASLGPDGGRNPLPDANCRSFFEVPQWFGMPGPECVLDDEDDCALLVFIPHLLFLTAMTLAVSLGLLIRRLR